MELFGMILWVSSNLLHAQISDFEAKILFERSIYIQKTGMIVLGSWATLNILSGIPVHFKIMGTESTFIK